VQVLSVSSYAKRNGDQSSFCKDMDADGYAEDAIRAIALAFRLMDTLAHWNTSQEIFQYMQITTPHRKSKEYSNIIIEGTKDASQIKFTFQ
jgi:hypothetical protein